MKVKSKVKAGGEELNHNQSVKGLRVKSGVRAGGLYPNHNRTVKGLLPRRIAVAALTAVMVTGAVMFSSPGGKASAAPRCKNVRGHVTSQTVTENCASPIGLCAAGQFYGAIRGELLLVATGLTPTQDTPATGVYIYTADNVIKTRDGDIYTKDAGALNLTPGSTGDDISIVTITGGTGAYEGATGRLRAYGTFSESGGEFSYEGELCTP